MGITPLWLAVQKWGVGGGGYIGHGAQKPEGGNNLFKNEGFICHVTLVILFQASHKRSQCKAFRKQQVDCAVH